GIPDPPRFALYRKCQILAAACTCRVAGQAPRCGANGDERKSLSPDPPRGLTPSFFFSPTRIPRRSATFKGVAPEVKVEPLIFPGLLEPPVGFEPTTC